MLEVRDMSFSWPARRILRGVSFSVASGETVALAGANGAGKTTLMRILAGALLPSSGTARADGADSRSDPVRYRRHLGYLPENAPAEPGMTVKSYLKFRAAARGEQMRKIRHRVLDAMDMCGITDLAGARIGLLSHGQRRRVALADAVLLRPRLLLLDDVFSGLDAPARESVVRMLAEFSQFSSIVVSGHELETLGRCAKRFLCLGDGRIGEFADVAAVRKAIAP